MVLHKDWQISLACMPKVCVCVCSYVLSNVDLYNRPWVFEGTVIKVWPSICVRIHLCNPSSDNIQIVLWLMTGFASVSDKTSVSDCWPYSASFTFTVTHRNRLIPVWSVISSSSIKLLCFSLVFCLRSVIGFCLSGHLLVFRTLSNRLFSNRLTGPDMIL